MLGRFIEVLLHRPVFGAILSTNVGCMAHGRQFRERKNFGSYLGLQETSQERGRADCTTALAVAIWRPDPT
jgi:hypothetical protein